MDLEINQKGNDVPVKLIKVYGSVEVKLQSLLTLSLDTREWSLQRQPLYTP